MPEISLMELTLEMKCSDLQLGRRFHWCWVMRLLLVLLMVSIHTGPEYDIISMSSFSKAFLVVFLIIIIYSFLKLLGHWIGLWWSSVQFPNSHRIKVLFKDSHDTCSSRQMFIWGSSWHNIDIALRFFEAEWWC